MNIVILNSLIIGERTFPEVVTLEEARNIWEARLKSYRRGMIDESELPVCLNLETGEKIEF